MPLTYPRRTVWAVVLGTAAALACGSDDAAQQCYEQATLPGYDFETGVVRTCDVEEPIPRRFPEYEDTEIVDVSIPRDGECPMCPEELDDLFWQAFLLEMQDRGLADGEDPDCAKQGYAIEIACLGMNQLPGTCTYYAVVASHCTLRGQKTPVLPPLDRLGESAPRQQQERSARSPGESPGTLSVSSAHMKSWMSR